ncbi:MAG TPA: hypothetical protein VE641_18325 [Chthoniobacterales bacterium]|jgi:hypothetical protein|nr:hypothetical protein [Chthoniobacterales bacterium]
MTHHALKFLMFASLALATPLAAQDASSIRAALSSGNYGQATALTKQAFAGVQSPGEAGNLIQSIIGSAPAEEIPPLVVAAIEGNPNYGQSIVQAAITGATKEEAAAILTAAYFALSQNPGPFANLLTYIADALAGTIPINDVLTMPWFNPANTIGVTVTLSPATPGVK